MGRDYPEKRDVELSLDTSKNRSFYSLVASAGGMVVIHKALIISCIMAAGYCGLCFAIRNKHNKKQKKHLYKEVIIAESL